jgi:polyphosphate kinase
VLAIKQTLYRTGVDSPMAEALLEAARAGKEVTAVVELRARFDEAANIGLATRLQQAGVTVVYGIVGYKTHAKVLLIVRREDSGGLRRYVHLGTGNYHSITTQFYCDFSFLTSDPQFGEDVHNVFMQLTGLGQCAPLHKLLMSPFTLLDRLLAMIEREAEHAREGKPARIVMKANAITEPKVIEALYRASQAGVSIDLIIRGICCLRPGVPGVSEKIRVRSLVGRFLEHHRVYYFLNDGQEQVYCGSADLMSRNLMRRVETALPDRGPGPARARDPGGAADVPRPTTRRRGRCRRTAATCAASPAARSRARPRRPAAPALGQHRGRARAAAARRYFGAPGVARVAGV